MSTVGETLARSVEALNKAGVQEANLDARLLVACALKRTPGYVFGYPEVELTQSELAQIDDYVARRVAREPLALITGEKEFWSLRFAVSPATLVPRPDSETLIEAVLKTHPDKAAPLNILDLGTGSGCLILSLLHEYENASGTAVDASAQALDVARLNAQSLGLSGRVNFVNADWNKGLASLRGFDVVICNPPYVPEGDKQSLQREVVDYEPHSALFAGAAGLTEYPTVISLLPNLLKKGGAVFFEVGIGQAEIVAAMMTRAGIDKTDIYTDLAGIGRCVTGTL